MLRPPRDPHEQRVAHGIIRAGCRARCTRLTSSRLARDAIAPPPAIRNRTRCAPSERCESSLTACRRDTTRPRDQPRPRRRNVPRSTVAALRVPLVDLRFVGVATLIGVSFSGAHCHDLPDNTSVHPVPRLRRAEVMRRPRASEPAPRARAVDGDAVVARRTSTRPCVVEFAMSM
jgi:hypothetical protein